MPGNPARQRHAADRHLNQPEHTAATQALGDHHHATGHGADTLPALYVLVGMSLERGGFDALYACQFAHDLSPG
ncbi:hypothetical protein D3C84_940640 [compost metagenome]